MFTEDALPWIYGVPGVLLFIWGWVQLGLNWGNVASHPTAEPVDALNLFGSQNPFSISHLFGWATVAEGAFLVLIVLVWVFYDENFLSLEIRQRRNYIRWIRWALVDAVFLAALAFLVNINESWVIISLTVVAIALNFAQAANETENALIKGGYEKIDAVSGDKRWDSWLVATLVFAYLAVLLIWKLAVNGKLPSTDPAFVTTGVYVAIIGYLAIYFILHLVIAYMTNFKGFSQFDREAVFEVARFASFVIVTISAYNY